MSKPEAPRRNPLTKEKFLEGNRQKWCVVFIVLGLVILGVSAAFPHINPAPFMTYFTTIGGLFIIGSSLDSVLKIQKAGNAQPNRMGPPPDDLPPQEEDPFRGPK